jgi:GT2 family glycosyltransferase
VRGVTVVCVLHDSGPDLEVLLDSMDHHLTRRPQLVVVDTGSTDDGPQMAALRGAEVVSLPDNPGFGAANNAGVARASGDVCLLLNPDIVLVDAGLERLVAAARERDALHVPRLRSLDAAVQDSAHPLPGTLRALLPAVAPPGLLPARERIRAEPWRSERPRPVGWAIAAAMAARTATLRALGPFDRDAFLFYEDMDLCLRARAAGVPTLLHPGVELLHAGQHATSRLGTDAISMGARRRREVVGARLGPRALALDDLAQGLTFATRTAARLLERRPSERERTQLKALLEARRRA